MNLINYHNKIISNYRDYIQSFLNIKDPAIISFVDKEISDKKLWPEPLVQFNPTFEKGSPLSKLVDDGHLHKEIAKIFSGYGLYKHQEEAISLGCKDKEFIVTSGTGSGKSLTYIATIFNKVLQMGSSAHNKVQAVIVYPMNALINSQYKEIDKFKKNYEEKYGSTFPITFGQYTGQETETERDLLRTNPPNIVLTNYMMLELILTRGGKDIDIRESILENIRFLVFDELHTYRGRQGSDVSMLIRRIKSGAKNGVICIGTSATMVSSDNATLQQQREKVAEIASTIFGTDITYQQVVNEYLVKSLSTERGPTVADLQSAINKDLNINDSAFEFEKHATAKWIEEEIALESKEGKWVRRKPVQITGIAEALSNLTGVSFERCFEHIQALLQWANKLNSDPQKNKNYLPYRLHQFIAQTGSVYATLGDQKSRKLYLNAGLYSDDKNTMLFPLMFSRTSGHEFTCVKLSHKESKLYPREFYDIIEDDDEGNKEEGYIFIQHTEDEELLWDYERDEQDLPETWFNPQKKDRTRAIKTERRDRLPRKIYFDKHGDFSFIDKKEFEGWYISAPLMFDPTSGALFDSHTAEWTKLMKLGGEGRSTATTVLSFETITQLQAFDEPSEKQKLLSFTDNRQDASLQAGHFNDFIKVGQLRAAIAKALDIHGAIDYTNIAEKVFACLNIPQEQFAKQPASFPGPKKENEDAFKDFITYRIIHDLRRSWRVVLPNLEQCALLGIEYKHLAESIEDHSLWQPFELLYNMTPEERKDFLYQVFDYFRKSYALSFSMLEPAIIMQNGKRIKEKLRYPWTLDETEKIEFPSNIRVEKLSGNAINLYTESASSQSVFGRYVKKQAKLHNIELKGKDAYNKFVYNLFDFLCEAGWLSKKPAKSANNEQVSIYQLKVDNLIWQKGDGKTLHIDKIKSRSYKPIAPRPNLYFQRFYQTNFHAIKPIEGREHTGQINAEKRKQREDDFREGKIGALFCSPTMELGIDISDLSVVHMRNVPPSPSNYAQRSGRAGRSGQAALVMVYCSNYSAHDRHYFKNAAQMVAGTVTAPRIDLINEELLHSHLHASILTKKSLASLNNTLGEVVLTDNIEKLPLRQEIIDNIKLSETEKATILHNFKKVINDTYFTNELGRRKPSWFNDNWIKIRIDNFETAFDKSLDRWRKLYRAAQNQIKAATSIIENRIYADNHDKKREAYKILRQAERQRDLLLNDMNEKGVSAGRNKDQSEFYPYRYLAAEGFLPGYNFTRLPVRAFMENEDQGGEYISRPRFIALNEFGPQNIIYHDGSKYRVNRIIMSEAETKLDKAKISPYTGYIMMNDQYNYNVDPIVNIELNEGMDRYTHTDLVEMTESRAYELQRITCQEEERTRKGYDIKTYFHVDGSFDGTSEALVKLGDEKLLHIHSIPAAKLVQVNFKWRVSQERGYPLNLKSGYWQNKKQEQTESKSDDIRKVKLYATDTANALYIQPIAALGLQGGGNGIITLMYALKRAIENYFQVESNEIGATIMGESDTPNILIYEASEGSLGVLSQIVDNPEVYRTVMKEAYELCFFENGFEKEGEVLPATYDDLLSYYNQHYHQQIDRNLIREALRNLSQSNVEVIANKAFSGYDEQYHVLQAARDHNSETEDAFLKYLYTNELKLPDEAQPKVDAMFVRPDFFYKPNIYIFCDGAPHDAATTSADDVQKRDTLKNAGYQVLTWHYMEPINDFIARRPDIFKKVK
ncbi:MAG: DEAD/DEAH box helicase [Taibaiella sp.]|nr:DEAD/DEAH box helicase [Taibaiella sp.]